MTANIKAKPGGYHQRDAVTSGELDTIQTQAAQSVNRTNTTTAWKCIPICTAGTYDKDVHFDSDQWDYTPASDDPTTVFAIPDLPDGHSISGLRVKLKPAETHSTIPENFPAAAIARTYFGNAAPVLSTVGTTATFTTSDLATYEAGILLSTSFTPVTIDKSNYTYSVVVTPEYGATNARDGTRIVGIQVHVTVNTAEGGPDFLFW